MKILMVGLFDPGRNDAAKIHFVEVANAMRRRGHELSVLVPRGDLSCSLDKGVRARCFGWRYTDSLFSAVALTVMQLVAFFFVLNRGVDLVYIRWRLAPCSLFRLLAMLKGIKTVFVSEHNGWTDLEVRLQRNNPVVAVLGRMLQVLDAKAADMTVCVTSGIRDLLARHGVAVAKIMVVGNGTNTSRFRPLQDKGNIKRRLLDRDGLVLGYMGNISKWQGLDELLAVMPEIRKLRPDALLAIIGSGLYEDALRRKIQELDLGACVVFRPHVPYEQANLWMNAFDIALAPKSKKLDAVGYSPLKIRDYAAAGLPVVSTRVNGIKELEAYGWLRTFDPDASGEFGTLLLELLSDREILEVMGKKARAFAEDHFSWDQVVEKIFHGLQLSDCRGADAWCGSGLRGGRREGKPYGS